MPRNMIARIETIEVHAHTSKLITAVIGERPYPLVGFATLVLSEQRVRELFTDRKLRRIRRHESNERCRIRAGVSIYQTTPQRFGDT